MGGKRKRLDAHGARTMPTFSQLPSGRWRVPVRGSGTYKAHTVDKERDSTGHAKSSSQPIWTAVSVPEPLGSGGVAQLLSAVPSLA